MAITQTLTSPCGPLSLHICHVLRLPYSLSTTKPHHFPILPTLATAPSHSTFVEQLAGNCDSSCEDRWDHFNYNNNNTSDKRSSDFDVGAAGREMRHLGAPVVEVKELEELPEQWTRSKLAWLCEELPSHKAGTLEEMAEAGGRHICGCSLYADSRERSRVQGLQMDDTTTLVSI